MNRYQSHIERLSLASDRYRAVAINYDAELACGQALISESRITLPRPIETASDYSTALHEIGHIRSQTARLAHNQMLRECEAWRYAVENAEVWNAETHADLCTSLALYDSYLWPHGQSVAYAGVVALSADRANR